jgi:predicted transport protein
MSEKSERDKKIFQSYLDTIKAKTGKTPDDFRKLAKEKGLTKAKEVTDWLKEEYGLGYGHAGAIWHVIGHADNVKASPDDRLAKHFVGKKETWRKPYDALAAKINKFGADVEISPNMSYINVVRGTKKFAIVQVSSAERLDIGIKLKGLKAQGRLESSGSWNAMVTHRIKISDVKEIDKELLEWLKQAYDQAASAKKI